MWRWSHSSCWFLQTAWNARNYHYYKLDVRIVGGKLSGSRLADAIAAKEILTRMGISWDTASSGGTKPDGMLAGMAGKSCRSDIPLPLCRKAGSPRPGHA